MTAAETEEHVTSSELIPEYAPKVAFVAEVAAAGSRLAQFSIEFTNDRPGRIRQAAAILEKHKVNILTGSHESFRWTFFADLSQSDANIAQLGQ